ncbi:hypothetical protein E8E13_003492 [Curvularia kusanoi]|uniref:Uncharacterized protein n=1 Tax=Curvularia kusanoi TaxID=90978 RepID=A0A9P4T600_CURKU|nr:hypothetical protein E8E13_003492 [Curvularia kusanoi]
MPSFRFQVLNSPPTPKFADASKPPNPNPQTQSPFLQRLPAELRNQIYTLVFTPTTTPTTSPPVPLHNQPPHPLTLLQTCRLIHHEAHLLAFTTYTFSLHADAYPDPPRSHGSTDLKPPHIPQGIEIRTSLLSSTHRSGINSLTLHHGSGDNTTSVLSWLISTLPSLSHIALLINPSTHSLCPRSWTAAQETDLPRLRVHNQSLPLPLREARTYAPPVLLEICYSLLGWTRHTGRWVTHWPQSDSAASYTQLSFSDGGQVREELVMDTDSVDSDLGIGVCGCNREPRHVVWTKAVLVQADLVQAGLAMHMTHMDLIAQDLENPRRITVSVSEEPPKPQLSAAQYGMVGGEGAASEARAMEARVRGCDGGSVRETEPRCQPLPSTVLVPGAVPLTLSELIINGRGGFEGSEEYWERVRRRNGNPGAVLRGWWRSAMAPSRENVSYAKLTR